jgi:hypothetical protein
MLLFFTVSAWKSVAQLKYLVTALKNQNCFRKEIKSELNHGNARYNSVRNLLPYRRLFKNVEIRKYIIIILPVLCVDRNVAFHVKNLG